jgi:hypothetical protein
VISSGCSEGIKRSSSGFIYSSSSSFFAFSPLSSPVSCERKSTIFSFSSNN